MLVGDLERLLARQQKAHVRRGSRHGIDKCCHVIGKMLAVVEHEQHPLTDELGSQAVGGSAVAGEATSDRLGHGRRHEQAVRQRRELHPPDAIRIIGRALRGDLPGHRLRDPRLADASGAGDRHDRMHVQQRGNRA